MSFAYYLILAIAHFLYGNPSDRNRLTRRLSLANHWQSSILVRQSSRSKPGNTHEGIASLGMMCRNVQLLTDGNAFTTTGLCT
jgi:hypothetical protein